MEGLTRWLHLLAAGVWTGGLIVLGALVGSMRRAGVSRDQLRAVARRFGAVSWTAMGVAVLTGVGQLAEADVTLRAGDPFTGRLAVKLTMVGIAASLALAHQLTARSTGPAVRGLLQVLVLVASLGIFAAAVAL